MNGSGRECSTIYSGSEMYSINLNDTIKIKLKDVGRDILNAWCEELERDIRARFDRSHLSYALELPERPQPDKDGYFSFQLWEFAHIFGNHCHMGKVFCETKLILETDPSLEVDRDREETGGRSTDSGS